jgi:hypothetical protein
MTHGRTVQLGIAVPSLAGETERQGRDSVNFVDQERHHLAGSIPPDRIRPEGPRLRQLPHWREFPPLGIVWAQPRQLDGSNRHCAWPLGTAS